MMMDTRDRFEGCLLGLAIGDALGMPVENWPRGRFEPVSGMRAGGPFGRAAGTWTDDTAMALCLAESLLEAGRSDPFDQMMRYCAWARGEFLAGTGTNLDIGTTVAGALARFLETGEPFAGSPDPASAGNGCIMRLAPVPMFHSRDLQAAEEHAALSARTTHGATECVDACRLLARMIGRALQGNGKGEILFADKGRFSGAERIVQIANGSYVDKPEAEIRGSGYVVECLEAALWCFYRTDDFSGAVLQAVNLGADADTTAAVCGQVAGAHYGMAGIPAAWLEELAYAQELRRTARLLYSHRATAA